MTDTIISVRVEKHTRDLMRQHDDINWSAVIRNSIDSKLDEEEQIDARRAKKAIERIDKMRNAGAFDQGKSGTELIREWRDKRK